MAYDVKSRSNKQMTITFTLPISCQICLGKVKQPVLCPNLHVFCNLCLDIWLSRNSQCPACRVDIGPDNPVKHIIGGHVDDENTVTKSTPGFRRARFDLLYQEYEDQLAQITKENIVLKTENSILTAQLKDTETKNDNYRNESGKKSQVPGQAPNGVSLLTLTKKLQEAQKLYLDIKADMSHLRQENCKLKDENMHLTRENEMLRLEIAQRSPKKFGRYTVATLEAKIAEQEKEIRQLKKALEHCDSYIEELQCQQDNPYEKYEGKKHAIGSKRQQKFQINLEPKNSTDENCSFMKDGPRKVLFGKVYDEEHKNNDLSSSATVGSKSSQKQHNAQIIRKDQVDRSEVDMESLCHLSHVYSRQKPEGSVHAEAHTTVEYHTESLRKSGMETPKSEDAAREIVNGCSQDVNSRRVHFDIPDKNSNTSSFDLDMPSPASSLISDSNSSENKDLLSPKQKSRTHTDATSVYDSQVKISKVPLYHFQGNINNPSLRNTLSMEKKLSNRSPLTSGTLKKSKQSQGKTKRIKIANNAIGNRHQTKDADDSSHLSIPDDAAPKELDNLSDASDVMDDLDISMTPELTDCLKLMSQAEKKMSSSAPIAASSQRVSFPEGCASSSETALSCQHPNKYNAPLHNFQGPLSLSKYLPAASIKSGQDVFVASGGSISSWEQQFYSTLKVNPYKYANVNQACSSAANARNLHHNDEDYKNGIDSKQVHSSQELNPSKGSTANRGFIFSLPVNVNNSSSDNTSDTFKPVSLVDSAVTRNHPYNLYLSDPSSSSVASSIPTTSSSGYNFTASRSAADADSSSPLSVTQSSPSEFSPSLTHSGQHIGILSSSFLKFPRNSTRFTPNNPISTPQSNSELEWPEDIESYHGDL